MSKRKHSDTRQHGPIVETVHSVPSSTGRMEVRGWRGDMTIKMEGLTAPLQAPHLSWQGSSLGVVLEPVPATSPQGLPFPLPAQTQPIDPAGKHWEPIKHQPAESYCGIYCAGIMPI